jgi:small subunit ribosomal protein S6
MSALSLYESVILIQQDISPASIDQIIEDLKKVLLEYGATLLKQESWDLRSLAYEIKGNSKAHYFMLYIECSNDALKEYERKMQLSENIIRFMNLKVESMTPTPLLETTTVGRTT